jgi:ATP-dependent helicase HrpB
MRVDDHKEGPLDLTVLVTRSTTSERAIVVPLPMVAAPRPASTGLPVEAVISELRTALAGVGAAVLQAEPGAGKTTVVPLRLLDEPWMDGGHMLVLEPRRVAARAAAARMATLLGERVGETVGISTRDGRQVSSATRIEVVTDGILTRRLQRDPTLDDVSLVVFDEFHERHLQADLGLALTLDAREGLRPELRVLVMSATLDSGAVSALLGDAPVVLSRGRSFPVDLQWMPLRPNTGLEHGVVNTVRHALERDTGDVLVFLPGTREISTAIRALGGLVGVDVLPLHGTLPAAEQDRALTAGARRRVVIATDVAESSVTVEGVTIVIDSGLARRPAYDPASGLSRLRTIATSRASADQRAGRAGRTAPGVAYRLWSESEHLRRRMWPESEIVGADLAPLALELAAWGAPAEALQWLDPPPHSALAVATTLLIELGALTDGRPTALGRRMLELPLHPRLARMVLEATADGRRAAALLAAMLSERDVARRDGRGSTVSTDIAERLVALGGDGSGSLLVDRSAVATVRRRADEVLRRARLSAGASLAVDPGPLLALGYPDRIAQLRGGARYRLRHGSGATLPERDPLTGSAWIVAAEIEGADRKNGADSRIRLAAVLDREDVESIGGEGIATVVRVAWDEKADDLRATTERVLDSLILDSARTSAPAGPETTAVLVAHAVSTDLAPLGWSAAARTLQARVGWARTAFGDAWPACTNDALAADADAWLTPLLRGATGKADLQRVDMAGVIRSRLEGRVVELDRLVPRAVILASGKSASVVYDDERPRIAVRAQDLYGTAVHPTIANDRIPVTVEVLSPAGRPIQITGDLPGFWSGSWATVRREMAARYPRHHWPDNPATAIPGQRPRPRR